MNCHTGTVTQAQIALATLRACLPRKRVAAGGRINPDAPSAQQVLAASKPDWIVPPLNLFRHLVTAPQFPAAD